MTYKTSTIITLLAFLTATGLQAQDQTDWLNNTMFASGKIKVVATVISVAFVLIVGYLVYLDRKVKKLEEREKNELK